MPDIHINRGGQSFGPYPEDVARQHLEAGSLLPTDLAWHEGADGWKPLSEVLAPPAPQPAAEEPPPPPPPDGAATDGAPPPPDGDASDTPPPPDGDSSDSPPSPDDGGDKDTIHVTRRGDAIGPYPRAMASEYFTGGSLLPTDWGWHEGMEEWKPLYEVLDLPVPDQPVFNPAMAPQRGGGKGKKIAKIAGLAVLAIGLIAAGILYGPKLLGLLGGGKIDTPEELAEKAVKAFSKKDFEAFKVLTPAAWSEEDYEKFADEFVSNIPEENLQKFQKLQSAFGQDEIPVDEMRQKIKEDILKELKKDFNDSSKLEESFSDLLSDGEEDGVDWSKVNFESVDTSDIEDADGKLGGMNAREGDLTVTISYEGKQFEIKLDDCIYFPWKGWVIFDAPDWRGEK